MATNDEKNNTVDSRHMGTWCGRSSSRGIFCGLMMLIIGVIWIGKKTGFIPMDLTLFWPSVMIMAGIFILVTALMRRKRSL